MEKVFSFDSPEYEDQDNVTGKNCEPNIENEATPFPENTLEILQETNNLLFYPSFEDISNTSSSSPQQNNDSNNLKWFKMLTQECHYDSLKLSSENISDIDLGGQIDFNSELNYGTSWPENKEGNSFEDFIPSISSELNRSGQSRNWFSSWSSDSQISNCKPEYQACLFSEDHYSSTGNKCTCGWSKKHPNKWNNDDIQNWIGYIIKVTGIDLKSKNFENIDSGKQLKAMTLKEFQQRDFIHGEWIHNILKKMLGQQTNSHVNSGLSKDTESHLASKNEDKFSAFFSNSFNNDLSKISALPLYGFIYAALESSVLNPQILRWENEKSGIFRFIDPDKFAKLWGLTKNNRNMNYEKLSRSLRHYYPKRILKRIGGKRLIYRFLEPYFTSLKKRITLNKC